MISTAVRYLLLYGKMADGCSLDISIHHHCKACFQRNCTTFADNTDCCKMMDCPEECGARFHGCKQIEHSNVCRNAKVHCVNHSIGCPIVLSRSKLGKHLETCPASVVYCTMEWNRWPSFTKDKPHREYLPPLLTQDQSEQQLDVVLALRDQRMLNESMKMPRKFQRALRNSLTRRYPAMPFAPPSSSYNRDVDGASNDTSATASDDGSDAPWEVHKNPPGLQKSICNKLFNQDKVLKDDQPLHKSHLLPTLSETEVIDSAKDHVIDQTSKCEINEIDHVGPSGSGAPEPPPTPSATRLSLDLTVESVPRYQSKPKSMYTFLCAQSFRRDEFCAHVKNIHSDIHPGVNGWMEERCPLAHAGCQYSFRRFCPSDKGHKLVYSEVNESFGIQYPVPKENMAMEHDNSNIRGSGDDSNAICDQKCDSKAVEMGSESDAICDDLHGIVGLPFEILQNIARCLDAFSLCHLAVTCRLLREVCCSLLEERGIVVLQWEKNPPNTKPLWEISFKRWFFSSAFTPVEKWRFTDHEPMAKHLKKCLFNEFSPQKTEKYPLPGMEHALNLHPVKRNAVDTPSSDF